MSMYDYWGGTLCARVLDADLCLPFRGSAPSLAFMNKVFATWHHDINACNGQKHAAARATLEAMGKTAGAFTRMNLMMSVKDLYGCFRHYDANNRTWRDSNDALYGGGAFFGGCVNSAPWAMVTFADAYDANLKQIQDLIEKQKEQVARIKAGIKGTTILWKEVNEPLKKFDEYTKAIDPLMVMCPEAVVKGSRYTWVKNFATLTGAMDDWMNASAASGSVGQSAAVVALSIIVSKCVPVFGDLYAEALKGVPNAIRFFENIKWERDHTLAQFGRQYQIYR